MDQSDTKLNPTQKPAGPQHPSGPDKGSAPGRTPKAAGFSRNGAADPAPPPAGTDSRAEAPGSGNMDFIMDIPLEISVELGRTRMKINELLKLSQGSVVELAKLAGESLDILANQRLIARGEVVVLNEKYGIRLTEIVSPAERIERLG